jgi:hypothetical protein
MAFSGLSHEEPRWATGLSDKLTEYIMTGKIKPSDTAEQILASPDPAFTVFKKYPLKFPKYFQTAINHNRLQTPRTASKCHISCFFNFDFYFNFQKSFILIVEA